MSSRHCFRCRSSIGMSLIDFGRERERMLPSMCSPEL